MSPNNPQHLDKQRKLEIERGLQPNNIRLSEYRNDFGNRTHDVLDETNRFANSQDLKIFKKLGIETTQFPHAQKRIADTLKNLITLRIDGVDQQMLTQMTSPLKLMEFYLFYDEVSAANAGTNPDNKSMHAKLAGKVFDIKDVLETIKDPNFGPNVQKNGLFIGYEETLQKTLEYRTCAEGMRNPNLGRRFGPNAGYIIENTPAFATDDNILQKSHAIMDFMGIVYVFDNMERIGQIDRVLAHKIGQALVSLGNIEIRNIQDQNQIDLLRTGRESISSLISEQMRSYQKKILELKAYALKKKNDKVAEENVKTAEAIFNASSSLGEEVDLPIVSKHNVTLFKELLQHSNLLLDPQTESGIDNQINQSVDDIAEESARMYMNEHSLLSNSPADFVNAELDKCEFPGETVFHDVPTAEKKINEYLDILAAKNGGKPKEKKDRVVLKVGNYFHLKGVATIKGKDGKDTQVHVDEYDKIKSVSANGVVFEKMNQHLSLDRLAFELLAKDARRPGIDRTFEFAYNNHDAPITSLHDVEKALNPNLNNTKNNEFVPGAVIKELKDTNAIVNQIWTDVGTIKNVVPGKGVMLTKPNGGQQFFSFPELLLKFKNTSKPLKISPPGTEVTKSKENSNITNHKEGSPFINVLSLIGAGKALWEGVKEERKRKLEIEGHLQQMIIWNLPQLKNKDTVLVSTGGLARKARESMLEMENKKVDNIKSKLEKMDDATKKTNILDFFAKYKKLKERGMDVTTLTSSFSNVDGWFSGKKNYDHRAEIKGHLYFILEHYGTLYPFQELTTDGYQKNEFWLNLLTENKETAEKGHEKSLNEKGVDDGHGEIWKLYGTFRVQPLLFGDEAAKRVESAYLGGGANNAKTIEDDIKKAKNKDKVKEILKNNLLDNKFSGVDKCFMKIMDQGASAEEVFTFFLMFYNQIRFQDNNGELRSRYPFEEMKDLAVKIAGSYPHPYFRFLQKSENFRKLDRILETSAVSDKIGKKPPYESDKVEAYGKVLWKMFNFGAATDDDKGGDYTLLQGYANTDTRSEYVTFVKEEMKKMPGGGPSFSFESNDPQAWASNPLLAFNGNVLSNLANDIDTSSNVWRHAVANNYFDAMLSSVQDMNASVQLSDEDKKAYLDELRELMYTTFYSGRIFDFSETRPKKADDTSYIGKFDISREGSKKRDQFFDKYNKHFKIKLTDVGLDPQSCYEVSERKKNKDKKEIKTKFTFVHNDTDKSHIPMDTETMFAHKGTASDDDEDYYPGF